MYKNQFHLLKKRYFLPLFITQFFGAFNDNFFKNAVVIMLTYSLAAQEGFDPKIYITLSGVMLILPMLLFSASAGVLAEKYEKSKLIRLIKIFEILLMITGSLAFYFKSIAVLMVVLFGMGMQSTFFGPLKYSILPQHLHKDELISGNGLIEGGTFLAIIFGNLLSAALFSISYGEICLMISFIAVSLFSYGTSCYIPTARANAPHLKIQMNLFSEIAANIRYASSQKDLWGYILSISWFWVLGFCFVTQFPAYTMQELQGNKQVFMMVLVITSLGTMVGSLLCNQLTKGRIEATYVPLAAFLSGFFLIDIYFATPKYIDFGQALLGPSQFLAVTAHYRVLFDIFMVSLLGGVYVVPLYTLLQAKTKREHTSRIIANLNIMNALAMIGIAVFSMVLFRIGYKISNLFLIVGCLTFLIASLISYRFEGSLIKSILIPLFKLAFSLEVKGIENLDKAGNKVVITPNHLSYLDGTLIAAILPGRTIFAVFNQFMTQWWTNSFRLVVDAIGIESTKPMPIRAMIKGVNQGQTLIMFPEGRVTVTGAIMKVYPGPGYVAQKTGAVIVPVHIDGAQYSLFSRLSGRVKIKWFPKITITFHEAVELPYLKTVNRQERQKTAHLLHRLITLSNFTNKNPNYTFIQSLAMSKQHALKSRAVLFDQNAKVSLMQLQSQSKILGRYLSERTKPGDTIALLLDNSRFIVSLVFGVLAFDRKVILINPTLDSNHIHHHIDNAQVALCISEQKNTIRLNTENLKLDAIIKKTLLNTAYKLKCILFRRLPTQNSKMANAPNLLFAIQNNIVAFSQTQIQSLRYQYSSSFDFERSDTLINTMHLSNPIAFALGCVLPILSGFRTTLGPVDSQYRQICESCYNLNATLILGHNDHLLQYARQAHGYDFFNIRYVFSIGSKHNPENQSLWKNRYGIRVYEALTVEDNAVIVSTNTPMHYKPGTMGQALPGVSILEESRSFSISSPSVMSYKIKNGQHQGFYQSLSLNIKIAIDERGFINLAEKCAH